MEGAMEWLGMMVGGRREEGRARVCERERERQRDRQKQREERKKQ